VTAWLEKIMSSMSWQWQISISFLLILVLGVLDLISGEQLSFSIFYLLPIYLVTWFTGRGAGYITAIFCAAIWLAADYLSHQAYTSPYIPWWNSLVRLSFFLLTAYLLSELKTNFQRRRTLERIFFHDILNLAGSIRGYAELLRDGIAPSSKEVYEIIYQAADRSLEEIENQRLLTSAQQGDLSLMTSKLSAKKVLELVVKIYGQHPVARGRTLKVAKDSQECDFESDQSLVFRILGNMVKNALEASPDKGIVKTGCRLCETGVIFWVQNQGVIDPDIQQQLFHHQVSTRDGGRGLGTYSMKILSEYLQGQVAFSSDELNGTIFTLTLPLQLPESK